MLCRASRRTYRELQEGQMLQQVSNYPTLKLFHLTPYLALVHDVQSPNYAHPGMR